MKQLLPLVLALLLGIAIGWMAKPHHPPPEIAAESANSTKDRLIGKSDHTASSSAGTKAGLNEQQRQLTKLEKALNNSNRFAEIFADVPIAQRGAMLDEFKDRAGLSGLGGNDGHLFEELLHAWTKLDSRATMAWVQSLENSYDRRRLSDDIIAQVAGTNLDQAMAWTRQYLEDERGTIRTPPKVLTEAVKAGPEKLLEAAQVGINRTGGAGGTSVNYPDGFDYAYVLNGLAEFTASLPEGHRPSMAPTNLLSEWAKVDPQAAYDWMLEGKKIYGNEGLEPFMEGYTAVALPAELGQFLAENMSIDVADPEQSETFVTALAMNPDTDLLKSFLENVPPDFAVNAFFEELMYTLSFKHTDSGNRARQTLLESMDADERYRIMTSDKTFNLRRRQDHRVELTKILRQLGHSEEDIGAMTAPPDSATSP